MIWFTSDTHFGHRNIIRYCNRPFKNVWEMNHQLIENWNAVVRPEDTVYHLGDFSFLAPKQAKDLIECLNGTIKIVRGNHDENPTFYGGLLDFFSPGHSVVTIDTLDIEMCHYPERLGGAAADFHMCGHIHTQWRSWEKPDGTILYNVGVDEWDYHPISIEDITEDMKNPKHRVTGNWKDAYHG
jgi:calcineurin-like phosphoesterase family protein